MSANLATRKPPELDRWSEWRPLRGIGRDRLIPAEPGLYRIRTVGADGLDYIGETGNSLRARLGMLNGIYRAEMPYRDPHTAGPALWALLQQTQGEFEASVTTVSGSTQWRKALEAAAITLHRWHSGRSPTANFGRMPDGAVSSSGNNKKLALAGKRFRGRLDPDAPLSAPSRPFEGDLVTDPMARAWMGLKWTTWESLQAAADSVTRVRGVYRIRRGNRPNQLAYIGQGFIDSRLLAHAVKGTNRPNRQAEYFAGALEASVSVLDSLAKTQLLEVECDLIGAYVLLRRASPEAQFLG